MQVEQVDFVSFLTQDIARARRFYAEMLGFRDRDRGRERMEFTCGQVTLDIFDPSSDRAAVRAEPRRLALRVADVRRRGPSSWRRASSLIGVEDTGVCHMASSRIRRQRADAPPPVRTEGTRESRRRARALSLAAASGHVDGGVAVHRPRAASTPTLSAKRPAGTVPATKAPEMLEIDVSGLATAAEARSRSTSSRTASSSRRSLKTTSAWAR